MQEEGTFRGTSATRPFEVGVAAGEGSAMCWEQPPRAQRLTRTLNFLCAPSWMAEAFEMGVVATQALPSALATADPPVDDKGSHARAVRKRVWCTGCRSAPRRQGRVLGRALVTRSSMVTPYVDKEFPPEFRSLGVALPRSCVWRRAPEVVAEPGVQVDVFTDCIEPSDVQQVRSF